MTFDEIDKGWLDAGCIVQSVVNVLIVWFSCTDISVAARGRGRGRRGRKRPRSASRGDAPAQQLFTGTCSARVFFALPDRNSLRDRRCRWQTSCDMSPAVRALRTRQLTSHLTRIHHSAGISSAQRELVSEEAPHYSRNNREITSTQKSLIELVNWSSL